MPIIIYVIYAILAIVGIVLLYFLSRVCFLRKHKLSVLFMKEVNQDGLEKTNIEIMFNMPQPKNLEKVATVL